MTDPWEDALEEIIENPRAFVDHLIFTEEPGLDRLLPSSMTQESRDALQRQAEELRRLQADEQGDNDR